MTLVDEIRAHAQRRGCPDPDLENPRSYNDQVHWLKLHDQHPDQIVCCDKWAVREWVAGRVGTDCLIPARLGTEPEQYPAMLKCTHDSGGSRRLESAADRNGAVTALEPRLQQLWGLRSGEWSYRHITPRLMTEQALPGGVEDYKFHCAHGQVRWGQVLTGRGTKDKRETNFLPDGTRLPLHLYHAFRPDPDADVYPGDDAWSQMVALASALAQGWRFVRVDLYWALGQAWFGEMTFWPMGGCYKGKDNLAFGEMLQLDLSYKLNPVAI